MQFDRALTETLIKTVAKRVIDHFDELGALDQAIGDGDHAINMRRGFEAVLADLDKIASQPLPAALQAIGMTMISKVGGSAGPLYGTLFMSLGKALPPEPTAADAAAAFDAAVTAVMARGKSGAGQKTMLDVLIPVRDAMLAGGEGHTLAGVRRIADEGAKSTIPMKAIRGRASFLEERSIGHMDAGARSAQLMIEAVLDVLAV
jgi:phosphoenolpyruvate---glycerone phosphotransferase subunit DhaL